MDDQQYAWTLDQGLDRDWAQVSVLLQHSTSVTCMVDTASGENYRDTWDAGLEAAEELYRVYRQYDLDAPRIDRRSQQDMYVVEAGYTARDGSTDGFLQLVGTLDETFAPDR